MGSGHFRTIYRTAESFLHTPILERMKGNHRQASTGTKEADRLLESGFQTVDFVVYGNPERLKSSARRMSPPPAVTGRNCRLHDLHKLAGGGDR